MKLQVKANQHSQEKLSGKTALHSDKKKKKSRKRKRKTGEPSKDSKSNNICCYCKGTRHWATKCPCCEEDEKGIQGKGGSTNLAIRNFWNLGTCELGQVYMVLSGSTSTAKVLLNCGMSTYMFCDRIFFSCSYKMNVDSETISIGDA